MEICYHNQSIIDSIYCHDAYFETFSVDVAHRTITAVLRKQDPVKVSSICFANIACCAMTGLEPWGHDDCRILNWQCLFMEDAATEFQGLLCRLESGNWSDNRPDLTQLVCSEFVMSTGDRICIACRSVVVAET